MSSSVLVRPYQPADHQRCRELFATGIQTVHWKQAYRDLFDLNRFTGWFQIFVVAFFYYLIPSTVFFSMAVILWQLISAAIMYYGFWEYTRHALSTDMADAGLDRWTNVKEGEFKGFLVAEYGGKVVGTISYTKVGPETIEIFRLSVDSNTRKLGIGRKLVSEVEKIGMAAGYTTLKAETCISQHSALGYYRRDGWQEVGQFEMHIVTKALAITIIQFRRQVVKSA